LKDTIIAKRLGSEPLPLVEPIDTTSGKPIDDLFHYNKGVLVRQVISLDFE
jgi:hypothetical protein